MDKPMLNTPRKRLAFLVLWLALLWASAVWAVVEKSRQFRFPVPVLSAVLFAGVSTVFTVYGIRIYIAAEKHRRGE